MERQRLCLVHMPRTVAQAFREAGHEVLELHPPGGGELDIAKALDGFEPDVLLQAESLGPRLLLRGLDGLSCRKIFWAVDPHLNGFWQAAYGRLFDAVCSTQTKWDADLKALGQEEVRFLPWFGQPGPWKPWERRDWDVAFVGRVTPQRPVRGWLLEFLQAHLGGSGRLRLASDLSYGEMLALYTDARLVPNESILGEVNFRLFEAASRGCLVLGQDIGPEQDGLFEPGREMETARNVLELRERIDYHLKNPREAKVKALAAWEKVRSRHLPEHRARALLEIAGSCGSNAATGEGAETWLRLAAFLLWEAGRWPLEGRLAEDLLRPLPPLPAVLAARVRLLARDPGRAEESLSVLAGLLASGAGAGDPGLDLAGSMAALRLSRPDLARQFWLRHLRAARPDAPPPRELPEDPARLCLFWSRILRARGPVLRPGFPFDPVRDLPASAAECLLLALTLKHGDVELLREMDGLLAARPGLDQLRLAFLSDLTLRRRTDWRPGLEVGLADLRCFRLEAGLEEVALALDMARSQGREAAFRRALEGRDPGGHVLRALSRA